MPIGWVGESVGRGVRPAREPAVLSWSQRARTAAMQVVAHVTGMDAPTRDLVPTIWTRWETAFDERVCPVCASACRARLARRRGSATTAPPAMPLSAPLCLHHVVCQGMSHRRHDLRQRGALPLKSPVTPSWVEG
ncbi:MAG: hypothetical protein R2839_09315 [Thermomicrobiales bacterium]